MRAKVHLNGKDILILLPTTVASVLMENNIHPDSVIALRNDKPVPITSTIKDGEEIRIVKVVSGG